MPMLLPNVELQNAYTNMYTFSGTEMSKFKQLSMFRPKRQVVLSFIFSLQGIVGVIGE